MAETGLLANWTRRYVSDSGPCYKRNKKRTSSSSKFKEHKPARMTLTNLSGAFVLLSVGIVASIFVFIGELIMFRYVNRVVVVNKKKITKPMRNKKNRLTEILRTQQKPNLKKTKSLPNVVKLV